MPRHAGDRDLLYHSLTLSALREALDEHWMQTDRLLRRVRWG